MIDRPILLDLYCCAGGAARGYAEAGFEVVGVDIKSQPSYPYRFVQGDALDYLATHWQRFDAIHASAPCQKFSKTRAILRGKGIENNHPDLIEPTRAALVATGLPFVMENVPGCPLINPVRLCGMMFGLRVYRHRLFESNIPLACPPHPRHVASTGSHRGYSTMARGDGFITVGGNNFIREEGAAAMGIDWMRSRAELSQAIPPAYTRYIGQQLRSHLFGESSSPSGEE